VKVGIIELIEETASKSWTDFAYRAFFKKYHASIIPQAVAVWCRQLGHQVWYSTYYGQRDPVSLLPDQLDVVFIASYTQASALAYALARSEEHTSELQSPCNLVCRLLLEKKNNNR